jgi:hypothetical protein
MATPTGSRAIAARNWFARERRRSKQDQKDFDIAGLVAPGGTPFDFGAVAAGGSSANVLTLPASLEIALQINAATVAGDLGVLDTTDAIDYVSAEAGISGGRVNIRKRFKEVHAIRITRAVGAPAGAVLVFFRGPKSQLVQFGQATFT